MTLFRLLILLALLAAAVSYGMFALTGQPRHRRRGWLILKWTLLAAFGFFAVLFVQQLWPRV